eukprot:UN17289
MPKKFLKHLAKFDSAETNLANLRNHMFKNFTLDSNRCMLHTFRMDD